MPTFRIEDEHGRWLTDMRLNAPMWRPGDRIPRGRDTFEVVEVRVGKDQVTLVGKTAYEHSRKRRPAPTLEAG
jgi:hypothetical protein